MCLGEFDLSILHFYIFSDRIFICSLLFGVPLPIASYALASFAEVFMTFFVT